jgi:hypothetical protein
MQLTNGAGNYCMQRRDYSLTSKADGKACTKSNVNQRWVAYLMPDGLYHLCKPDTLVARYKYFSELGVSYDGYFASCFGAAGSMGDTLLAKGFAGTAVFTAEPGRIDSRLDGHLVWVSSGAGLRLRTDDFRVDWNTDKAVANYTWTAAAW